MANNTFDYSNNKFNHASAFESLKFNAFKKAPKIDYQVGLSFIEALEEIRIHRKKKAFRQKIVILFVSVVTFSLMMLYFLI